MEEGDRTKIAESVARDERRALAIAAIAAIAAIVWIVLPIGVGILLGTLLAFMAEPLFERLRRRFGDQGSAVATVTVSIAALTATMGGIAWLFVARGTVLSRQLTQWFGPGGIGDGMLDAIGNLTRRVGIPEEELTARARSLAEEAAMQATTVAEAIAAATASSLLALFFATLSMHFILRNWHLISERAQETFPLRPEYTAALFTEFRSVGRTALLGTMVTGFAQGVLATVGYVIAGVPEAIFFGAATAVASLIPAIGTLFVWVPIGIALILFGHPARGVLELVWGSLVVVGVSDYFIRPRLVQGESKLPSLMTFAALFGGVEVFGLKGLFIGPVIMALAVAVLRLYATEAKKRRSVAGGAPRPP